MDQDPVVISFGDCALRKSDIDTLQRDEWVNDAIISFAFEVLSAKDAGSDKLSLWQPAAVELLCGLADQMGHSVCDLLPFHSDSQWIVLPVSDRFSEVEFDPTSGTHWSTVVVARDEEMHTQAVIHFDSLHPSNQLASEKVFSSLVQSGIIGAGRDVGQSVGLQQADQMQRQENAFDCGMYPICIAAELLRLLKEQTPPGLEHIEVLTSEQVSQRRADLYDWLQRWKGFPKEQQGSWERLADVEESLGQSPLRIK